MIPQSKTHSVFQTVSGTIISILVWIAIYVIGCAIFTFASKIQGTNSWLEALCRDLFLSGVGGYFALVAAKKWTPHANSKFVFWGFCSLVFILMIGSILVTVVYCPPSHGCPISWSEHFTTCLAGGAAIFGARLSQAS